MKGIMSVIEVMITGLILIVAFLHFFPQYSVRTEWDRVLLATEVMDTLNTIDRLGKTYDFATCSTAFNDFMGNLFTPETSGAMIWWKETEGLSGYTEDTRVPYFTQAYKESMVDVKFISEYSVDADTVALWHFNSINGSGYTLDETDNHNDGLVFGATLVDGMFGEALDFTDGNYYVETDNPVVSGQSELTACVWVKPNTLAKQMIIIQFEAFLIRMDDDGWYGRLWNESTSVNETIEEDITGDWHHLAITWDGETVRFFQDGDEKATKALIGGTTSSGNILEIGKYSTILYYNGTIDEVAIYSQALSPEEIQTYFIHGIYSFTLGLGYPY